MYLKVQLTRTANGLIVSCEKRGVNDDPSVFGLSKVKNVDP